MISFNFCTKIEKILRSILFQVIDWISRSVQMKNDDRQVKELQIYNLCVQLLQKTVNILVHKRNKNTFCDCKKCQGMNSKTALIICTQNFNVNTNSHDNINGYFLFFLFFLQSSNSIEFDLVLHLMQLYL